MSGPPRRRRPGRSGGSGPPRGRSGPARPPSEDPARQAALDTLTAVRTRDGYANLILPGLLRERRISGRDAGLATELTYGTCRAVGLLDAVLAECVDRPLEDVDGDLLDALRLGTYQLLRTRIPAHAALSSTVDLVRAGRGSGGAGFVNAVLRKVSQSDEAGWIAKVAPDRESDPVGHLAMAYPHPRWIVDALAESLDHDGVELEAALAADDERPIVHLVARPGELSADELAALTGGDVAPYSPYGVHLTDGGEPGELPPITERLAHVQDEGSQLVTLALAAAPVAYDEGRWLDLCAGPGGKAALLGALAATVGGALDAVEPAPHRARLVEQTCRDLPVRVHVADGRSSGLPDAGFDRVLVDAPCSGLGALRRRPEARWRRTPADVADLVRLQRELLLAGWRLLRPGGVLAYVTCSPHLQETTEVVAEIARRVEPEILDARPYFPDVPSLGAGPYVQLWTHRHGTDGMFCALLRKS